MNIEYKEFKKIKDKKDLFKGNKLKFPTDKLINSSYYLHHILIHLGKIKLADDLNLPIYEFNSNHLDGLMLTADKQDIDTLIHLLKKYSKYAYNTNIDGNTWLHFVEINFLDNVIFNKNLTKINWKKLIFLENNNGDTVIDYIFSSDKKKLIKRILDKYVYTNVNCTTNKSFLYQLFNNLVFSNNEIIEILKKLITNKVNLNRKIGYLPPHFSLFLRENKNIVDILYNYKIKSGEGEYGHIYNSKGSHLLFYLYNHQLNDKFMEYTFFKFKDYLQLNEKTINNEPILFSILNYEIDSNYVVKKITEELFKSSIKYKLINEVGDKDNSILHVLCQLPFNTYKKYHNKINFNETNLKDKFNNLPIDYTNDKQWIKKLSKYKETVGKSIDSSKDKLKLINSDKAHSTIFKAYIEDISLYFYFLKQKYPKLYIPNPKTHVIPINLSYDGIDMPHPVLEEFHEFAWITIYQKKDINYIHPYLDMLLKSAENSGKYEYSCLLLSIKNDFGGLHATPIFIDFKNKEVTRWDSFGYNPNNYHIDKFIKENLADKIKYKYVSLKFSQNAIGIQEKTLENESQNMKRGDFGGFCVAWTIWFIEHKIINKTSDTKKLINKLEKRIYAKDKPVSYIRNYSNYLFEAVKIIFDENNWDIDDYTNNIISIDLEDKIINFLIENL